MTQNEQLRKWLKSGKTISPLQALNKFGIFRLSARISDLKNEGMRIETKMIYEHPIKYAQYKLRK